MLNSNVASISSLFSSLVLSAESCITRKAILNTMMKKFFAVVIDIVIVALATFVCSAEEKAKTSIKREIIARKKNKYAVCKCIQKDAANAACETIFLNEKRLMFVLNNTGTARGTCKNARTKIFCCVNSITQLVPARKVPGWVAKEGAVIGKCVTTPNPSTIEPSPTKPPNMEPYTIQPSTMKPSIMNSTCSKKGLTWARSFNPSYLPTFDMGGAIHVDCHAGKYPDSNFTCNAYTGDTLCTNERPILCIQTMGLPPPDGYPETGFYNGWSGGNIDITSPIQGCTLASREVADAICAETFRKRKSATDADWRMAEFHDGGGGWSWSGYGNFSYAGRFWIAIRDQLSNCWDQSD
jgi:hypothetical protein